VNPEQLFLRLKKLAEALSVKQLLGLGLVFVAVIGVVIGSAYWIGTPDYALLMGEMDAETAASVSGKLRDANTPYRLGDGGRSISVPAERLDELRLQFASDGLPSGGRLGFEIFDRTAFGTTEFLEQVNYRRALEGELARTIGTLAEVASARVHISMAKNSVFVGQEQPAKASVVLRLRANRPLPPPTIKGIAGLVSASVEALRPESVTILDTYGRFLSRPTDEPGQAGGSTQLERQQQIERDLGSRVIALLEPAVGVGRVRVNVAATLTADQTEETEEEYDPEGVIRSRQSTSETGASAGAAGGIAGARANQPTGLSTSTAAGAAPTPVAVASPTTVPGRSSETANYEVSRRVRHTITGLGQVARLSVAVIVDDQRVTAKAADGSATTTVKPWDPNEVKRFQNLVTAAVGLDTERGDQLTIENMSFEAPPAEPELADPGIGTQIVDGAKRNWPALLRTAGITLVALFALFGILRPLARRATAVATAPALPAPATGAARLPTVSEMEGDIDTGEPGTAGQRKLPALSRRVAKLASDEPEQLARVVRSWMEEDPK
jgi:flagellar M-ring protein FliF